MTGSPRAWVSGVHTLTVSHSPVVSGAGSGPAGVPGNIACGHCGPNAAASRTPSHAAVGAGAWNRRLPTGGCANGTPRKTALPCSTRPLTRPALVETSGSAEPMGRPPATSVERDVLMTLDYLTGSSTTTGILD